MNRPPLAVRRSGWWRPLAITTGVVMVGLMLRALLLGQESLLRSLSPGCFVHRVTGFHCAGCGGTRAFFAFLKGDLALSWRMNPLFLIALGLAAMWGLLAILDRLPAGRPVALRRLRMTATTGWVCLGVTVMFTILRNLPEWPFTLLAPR